jgi:molybdenum cofactor synthesis domain-containing protein
MKVAVVCFGPLRAYLPAEAVDNRADLDLPAEASVGAVAAALGIQPESLHALLVDGVQGDLSSPLHQGAEVVLMPAFSGGATRTAVVTVSDSVAGGDRVDSSGDVAERLLVAAGFEPPSRLVSVDTEAEIEKALRGLVERGVELIVSTGGTGFGPRDVTPEATKRVIERDAPGLVELMRSAGLVHTPLAALSRGVAGIAGGSIVLNLPGSPKAVEESLTAVLPLLPHALELMKGRTEHADGDH